MSTLKFAEVRTLVTFLSKPTESEEFEQIVDFLNAKPIRYALIVNHTIYISRIKQFWTTAKARTINGEAHTHAKVDGKKERDRAHGGGNRNDCVQWRLMSSPNHPTFDIKDAFSSPKYTPASPDYSLASSKNTPSKSLNNSYGLVPIASPTLSLFHDDPYMKVMHAYDAIIPPQVPISPPIIVPPSLMLSPIFDPQYLFVLEELLSPNEQIHPPSYSLTTLSNSSQKHAYEAVYKELDDSLVRAATTASSLEAEQDSGNISKTQSKVTPNESSSQRTDSSGGLRGNIIQSDEDSIKLNELMELCKTLQSRVLDLEQIKTTQATKTDSLKRRVKKLKKKQRSRTHKIKRLYKVGLTTRVESSDDEPSSSEDASKQERISAIDADEGTNLVSTHDDVEMFDTDKDLHGKDVFVAKQNENVVEKEVDAAQVQVSTTATTATILIDEVTLAQALAELKHIKPKAKSKRIVFYELEESTTTTIATIPKPKSQDKGKAIMIKEPVKLKKKDQIMLDEEVALKTELVEDSSNKVEAEVMEQGSSKRAYTELEQESSKKQKIDDDKETAELKQLVKIIPNKEEVENDAIPLAVKPPSIVD
nr:hypothetical protein [Tanacetum cinerariifolium]